MTSPKTPETSLQKFRKTYPRVDYFPDVEAYQAIERMRQARPDASTRALVDALVVAGAKVLVPEIVSVSGNV